MALCALCINFAPEAQSIMKKLIFLISILLLPLALPAQNNKIAIEESDYSNSSIQMADTFRAEGKIYVVVVVAGIILSGIFVYLFMLDKKLSRLEKTAGQNN
jgi:CcmD family protein